MNRYHESKIFREPVTSNTESVRTDVSCEYIVVVTEYFGHAADDIYNSKHLQLSGDRWTRFPKLILNGYISIILFIYYFEPLYHNFFPASQENLVKVPQRIKGSRKEGHLNGNPACMRI